MMYFRSDRIAPCISRTLQKRKSVQFKSNSNFDPPNCPSAAVHLFPFKTMSEPDLSAAGTACLLSFAEELARRAGGMIRTAFHMPRTTYDRKSATDPVTETDRAVETKIFGAIRKKFTQHALIGEESAAETEWTDAPTWIVDPIDGTANCTQASVAVHAGGFFVIPLFGTIEGEAVGAIAIF